MCFCSWPTCKHGRCGYRSTSLYLSLKYWATVHSMVWPFSCCNGNLEARKIHFENSTLYHCIITMRNIKWMAFIQKDLQVSFFVKDLTFDGWLVSLSHYTPCIFSSSVHSEWFQPSDLIDEDESVFRKSLINSIKTIREVTNYCNNLPLISLVNFTLWESVKGFCCSSMLLKSNTSHINSITGWAL